MNALERLAWDSATASRRSAAERERVARYIVEVLAPTVGFDLEVGLSHHEEPGILNGCVVQRSGTRRQPAAREVWLGRMMGNQSVNESVAYSVVLFPFREGKRMGTRLRSVSAMWTGTVEIWNSGTTDKYDEWAYVASFLDVA
ncbi:MAG: hypothetical protein AAGE52_42450, partial [Myxococcota bacterium]